MRRTRRRTSGVVGCRLVLPDGRLLHAGTYMLADGIWGQQIGALETDVNQYARTRDVEGIVFACAYLRREVLDRIGGLSEKYVSYFEDTDYCLRAKEAGFRTVVLRRRDARPPRARLDIRRPEDLRGALPGQPEDVPRPLGEEGRGAVPARALVAVDPELPDGLRDELPRDPARAATRRGSASRTRTSTGPARPFPRARTTTRATTS